MLIFTEKYKTDNAGQNLLTILQKLCIFYQWAATFSLSYYKICVFKVNWSIIFTIDRDQMILHNGTAALHVTKLSSHLFYLQEILKCITDRDTWFKVRFCSEEQIHARLFIVFQWHCSRWLFEKKISFFPSIVLFECYLPNSD